MGSLKKLKWTRMIIWLLRFKCTQVTSKPLKFQHNLRSLLRLNVSENLSLCGFAPQDRRNASVFNSWINVSIFVFRRGDENYRFQWQGIFIIYWVYQIWLLISPFLISPAPIVGNIGSFLHAYHLILLTLIDTPVLTGWLASSAIGGTPRYKLNPKLDTYVI